MADGKPSRTRRAPQEVKRLSLERDRRNVYGENAKSSRKSIRKFKAASNRQGRHGANQALSAAGDAFEERDESRLVGAVDKAERPVKRKFADAPLGVVLERKKGDRAGRVGGKAKRRAPGAGEESGA